MYACCRLKNEREEKNFGEEKNPLKYNVLPMSNADVKKVDEDDFLSHSEKDDSIYCTRIYNNAHRVENRLLYRMNAYKIKYNMYV